jgi:solute:Na+ symporter, SSS family
MQNLVGIDIAIILAYIFGSIFLGFWISRKASGGMRAYFLGDNSMKWWMLGFSNSSGMFDINGAALRVALLMVYGLKSVWLPWIWPVWNQIFVMIFLAVWMRRSGALTGAEWITMRFGNGLGGRLSHMIVVVFAVITVVVSIGYFFHGIGPFAASILPWNLSFQWRGLAVSNEHSYALIICFLTTLYTIKGGMYSVVATEVMQYGIMVLSCVLVCYYAMTHVDLQQVNQQLPNGWKDFWPGWKLNIDWSDGLPFAKSRIAQQGYELFGAVVMMMVAKGVFASLAGPVPGFDMQRILSCKTPKEAAKMAGFTNLVLFFPLYLLGAGLTLIAFGFLMNELRTQTDPNFESILSVVVSRFLPVGVKGLVLAGLLAAFMSTFSAFVNAAPAYLVNDFYKKYFRQQATDQHYVQVSYLVSFIIVIIGIIIGFNISSLNNITTWITSALYGGYCAANVLKWVWWRFNGYGYFWGMVSGMLTALFFALPGTQGFIQQLPFAANFYGTDIFALYAFFAILLVSMLGSVLGCLLTAPTEQAVLLQFYSNTKPWGFWKPMELAALQSINGFKPNTNFARDMVNVVVGISWQMSMVVMPIYIVFGMWQECMIAFVVFLLTSWLLKTQWLDKMEEA